MIGIFKHKPVPTITPEESRLCKSVDISKKDRTKYSYVEKVISTCNQNSKNNNGKSDKRYENNEDDSSDDDNNSFD